uniref:Uncharacterized protein n=1 Tax=Globodera rostochiensis TaxID=31243 RepID=A0A914H3X8_GLORO
MLTSQEFEVCLLQLDYGGSHRWKRFYRPLNFSAETLVSAFFCNSSSNNYGCVVRGTFCASSAGRSTKLGIFLLKCPLPVF